MVVVKQLTFLDLPNVLVCVMSKGILKLPMWSPQRRFR